MIKQIELPLKNVAVPSGDGEGERLHVEEKTIMRVWNGFFFFFFKFENTAEN